MFNLGFLWLALSIGSEITGTSMIKKTNGFSKLAPSVPVVSVSRTISGRSGPAAVTAARNSL